MNRILINTLITLLLSSCGSIKDVDPAIRLHDPDSSWIFCQVSDSTALEYRYPSFCYEPLSLEEQENVKKLVLLAISPYSDSTQGIDRISDETHWFQVIPMYSQKLDSNLVVINGFCILPDKTDLSKELISVKSWGNCYFCFDLFLFNETFSEIRTGSIR